MTEPIGAHLNWEKIGGEDILRIELDVTKWTRDGAARLAAHVNDVLARGPGFCPRDTDGDGSCGQPYCPSCGSKR